MEIKEIQKNDVTIIEIIGRLDTSNYNQLESKINELLEKGHIRLLVDCSQMDYVSSSGLRIFLVGLKKIISIKGKFALCGLQENIREIFEISGFNSIFSIYPNLDEALSSF
ncbi:MAG: STAS domain-containing protein [Bacteroidales bacterium]|nr:STAS domain-containing protein [Bacteroidales bacterium]MDZ4205108.1 STAS domain-containing protein [Bacteroidales bacterium]